MPVATRDRRVSVGVEVQEEAGAHARVWAPRCRSVDLVIEAPPAPRRVVPLAAEPGGHFAALVPGLGHGDRYWYLLDGDRLRPDPASRFQPDGPQGASMVIDPATFPWSDQGWRGLARDGQVVYEMHVGTFTREGTWRAAAAELEWLADLGITVIEMMPIAEFAGRWGWGYDGVDLYAPTRLYGSPDDLRAFVDRAHALGLGVILDVVYNHLGPDGNFLPDFSPDYFTDRYENEWGQAVNFEGPAPARAFFVENAGYWIDEFHFDGLRLDATQDIRDASEEHAITSIVRRVRAAAGGRRTLVVGENEPQHTGLLRPIEQGGSGLDALWNDDYHHTAIVALTGRREAYYQDYTGSAQELISCAKYGFLYQGQWYHWQKQRRGTPALDLPPASFVAYLENHDQVANTAFGRRLHQATSPARLRAMTALLLLGPATPMLFQGQEFASSAPFLYFADHKPDLQGTIRQGRREFLAQFPSIRDGEVLAALPAAGEACFARSRLDLSERARHAEAVALHRDLLALRKGDAVFRRAASVRIDGAVLAPDAFLLRYFGGAEGDRLLIVNLGRDQDLRPLPEPLLAPPHDCRWARQWSSESVQYGGSGTPPLRPHAHLHVPAESVVVLASRRGTPDDEGDG